MTEKPLQIQVTVASRIKKYAEGVDPETGTPFEVVDHEPQTLTGRAAEEFLAGLNGKE